MSTSIKLLLFEKLIHTYPGVSFGLQLSENGTCLTVYRDDKLLLTTTILPSLVERLDKFHGGKGEELIVDSIMDAIRPMMVPKTQACSCGDVCKAQKAPSHHALLDLQKDIHAVAVEKGWWPAEGEPDRNVGELLALIHAEVSEAMEDYRKAPVPKGVPSFRYIDGTKKKPAGFWTEIADVVIRCLDLAEAHGVDLGQVIEAKHEYNKTREFRHGGKKA